MTDASRAQNWNGPFAGSRGGPWATDRPDRDWRDWPTGRVSPGRIALIVIGFILWWPIGLALLAYLIWSGRMSCWGGHDGSRFERKMARMQDKMERMRARVNEDWSFGRGAWGGSSGNRAFDEYKAETLRRLEEEQREFRDFLERLRQAKDKAEFDQFMAQRRRPAEQGGEAPQG